MHVPGMIRSTTCAEYPFAPSLAADAMTKSMLSSARCTDRDLGQLIGNLKRSGLYDDAIVIITADHAFQSLILGSQRVRAREDSAVREISEVRAPECDRHAPRLLDRLTSPRRFWITSGCPRAADVAVHC